MGKFRNIIILGGLIKHAFRWFMMCYFGTLLPLWSYLIHVEPSRVPPQRCLPMMVFLLLVLHENTIQAVFILSHSLAFQLSLLLLPLWKEMPSKEDENTKSSFFMTFFLHLCILFIIVLILHSLKISSQYFSAKNWKPEQRQQLKN